MIAATISLVLALQLADLPAAVRTTVEATLNGGRITHIRKEKEDGVEQYEIETVLNGKARGFNVDTKGTLLVIEEEAAIDAIPAAAKTLILNVVADGTLRRIEALTRPGQPTMYEAAYTDRKGKKHEVLVASDGTHAKD